MVCRSRRRSPTLPASALSSDAERALSARVQACGTVRGDNEALARLDSGPVVSRDDVELHDEHHPLFQDHVGNGLIGSAQRAEYRGDVAAAVTVDEIVEGRKACVFDEARRVNELRHVWLGNRRSAIAW